MSDFELQIAELKKKIEELENKKNEIPNYQYSKIRDIDLEKLVEIEENIEDSVSMENWLNNQINLNKEIVDFLDELIKKEKKYIKVYSEEDLKVNFIIPVLNKIDFKIALKLRGFYEEKLVYKSKEFIFSGNTDFIISKGLRRAEKPYFFIQEFKRAEDFSNPRPQLLAELISAVELNNWKTIKGAYIIGSSWNFVILERLAKHKYQYFVSQNFDSSKLEDLKGLYRNLLFVKQEIIEMVKKGE